ncbi:Exosome complex component RRP42 [Goodea atripinnis]|uniref:Exosome complex component RRP42 n=1 Tax=Goodea atripinnis TaxID=208336 RepID=A0ABV0PZZ8_9TELE
MRLDVENVPCIVTLCKIGHRHVVDATLQEKACSVASLIISVTHKGIITCTRKVGRGSLDPESICEMTEVITLTSYSWPLCCFRLVFNEGKKTITTITCKLKWN